MITKKLFHTFVFVAGILMLFCSLPLTAQENSSKPTINHAVASGISAPLKVLAKLPATPQYGFHEANPVRRLPKRPATSLPDPVEQSVAGPAAGYSIGIDVLGIGNGFPNYSVPDAPPDTNLAVGDTQIVQWVNVSLAVFDKSGTALTGAIAGNALWASGLPGSSCALHNAGDPVAQWDRIASRWLLSQNVFTSPYAVCVAVSTSSDALGSYYVYQFAVPGNGFPDYPKWGIWPTGYFQAQNNFGPGGNAFQGPQICAYNRAKLLVGEPTAEQQCFQLTSGESSLLPGDLDSPTPPPAGQDEFYIGSLGDVNNTHLSLYSFHADFANPANSFVTGSGNSQLVSIASFTPACNGAWFSACVPQKGISDLLASLGDRLMYRFAYYNDNASFPVPKQHWYVNFDVTASGGQNGVRWMEFTAPNTLVSPPGISVLQQSTYAPDTSWRWMGSMARDQNNDVLVGYSESGSNIYPSIFVAGRTPGDAFGTLESEVSVLTGAGSQPDTANRWGDYSAMRIDPVDNCTFWYTTEYYMVTQAFDWSTRIASAKFSGCPQSPVLALQFVPVTPCRVVDTRISGGSIPGGSFRTFNLPQLAQAQGCGDLSPAATYSLNVTVVPDGPLGYLTIWPAGVGQPLVSTMNSLDGRIKANAAIVPAGDQDAVNVYVTNTSNVVLDIDGYFAAASQSTLAFYPLTPCRVLDTRKPNGTLGGPYLQGGQARDFPLLESSCGIPLSAEAYSLNFTAVPGNGAALGYLTVWPTGESQPLVSTLNDQTGTIVANAAIVPAGTGGRVSVYPSNDTNLVADITGYFAASGPGGLSLYAAAPCRVIDTRKIGDGQPFSGTLSPPVDVVDSGCAPSSAARAYVFNATVVPVGALGYLTLWPNGESQPVVSTLNAMDGAITSNMAIVPANNGSIDAYATGLTQLILDISSYFAPVAK